jgi:hypothetical protein
VSTMNTDDRNRNGASGIGVLDAPAARVVPPPEIPTGTMPPYPPYQGYLVPVPPTATPPAAPVAAPVTPGPALRYRSHADVWGLLLIVVGGLALLQNLAWLPTVQGGFWAVAFAAGGILFLWRFLSAPAREWHAAIPGFTLLALAVLIGISSWNLPGNGSAWLGALFLGAIGLSFGAIYAARPDLWWSIIPGGTLLTLAAVAGMGAAGAADPLSGAVFFFGLALTFALVALLPTRPARMTWAIIPAGVLAIMGLMIGFSWVGAASYTWSAGLILAGLYLLYRHYNGRAERRR